MSRLIIYIIGTFLLAQANALACNFKIANFGSPKENIKIEPLQPVVMPDQFGGESLIIPMEDLCKNDKSLYGSVAIYLYIENKFFLVDLKNLN